MHHLFERTIVSLVFVTFAMSANAAPSEQTKTTITRNAQSELTMQSQLSKNVFRQEAYQDNYTVKVPYQDRESYTVQVPYQDTESYQDTETYYDYEQVCRSYTDYERRCRDHRECNFAAVSGFNLQGLLAREAGGERTDKPNRPDRPSRPDRPDRPDRPSRPPERPPRPPTCREVKVCKNEPVTRERCENERVTRTRWVTKYRTVTRHRTETRTREVTRYRNEERCCVTKYHDVFDHQWELQVEIQFPQGTQLQGNESESFELALTGTEAAPDIGLKPTKTIFGYSVASKVILNGKATIVLQQIPRYNSADVQQSSIQDLQVLPNQAGGLAYKFQDNAFFPRVSSTQQLIVEDASTGTILAQTDIFAILQRENRSELAMAWDFTRSYNVVLKVIRSGSVIENGGVSFEIRQPITLTVDSDALKSNSKITATVAGSEAAAQLKLFDDTIPYSSVITNYTLSIARRAKNGDRIYIGEKAISRTALTAAEDSSFLIPVSDLVKAEDLKYVKTGVRLVVTVKVKRQTHDGKTFSFTKDNRIVVD